MYKEKDEIIKKNASTHANYSEHTQISLNEGEGAISRRARTRKCCLKIRSSSQFQQADVLLTPLPQTCATSGPLRALQRNTQGKQLHKAFSVLHKPL